VELSEHSFYGYNIGISGTVIQLVNYVSLTLFITVIPHTFAVAAAAATAAAATRSDSVLRHCNALPLLSNIGTD